MLNIFCCRRKTLKTPNNTKLDLHLNKNKDASSIEVNQSQSLSIISNNLNNSTKDNIIQKPNKFNIVNRINNNKLEDMKKNNTESVHNVVYNIINVDNINKIINNKQFYTEKRTDKINKNILNNNEQNNIEDLNEREKKLFENQKELNNKENEINNKIFELIKKNKKLSDYKRTFSQKNSVINDIIKFKKTVSEKEKEMKVSNMNKNIHDAQDEIKK